MPQPREGHALVRIKRVGICGTDLHAFAGRQPFFSYPRILGHELSAEVVQLPPGTPELAEGDQVVIMPYDYCGRCVACRHGNTNCCTRLKVLGVHVDGGMQEYYAVPAHLLLPAEGLSLDEMAIVEPLAIGRHAVRRAEPLEGAWVLVIGCGPIGIGTIRMAQLQGARVMAMDLDAGRLAYCREVLGVSRTVLAGEEALAQVHAHTDGELAQVVFDATGNQKAMEAGPTYVGAGGAYVLIGLHKGPISFHHPSIHAKELSVLCSRNATRGDLEDVIEVLRRKDFPSEAYITHRMHFSEMIGQFESLSDPDRGVIKAITSWE